jgi:hypothetical protein
VANCLLDDPTVQHILPHRMHTDTDDRQEEGTVLELVRYAGIDSDEGPTAGSAAVVLTSPSATFGCV